MRHLNFSVRIAKCAIVTIAAPAGETWDSMSTCPNTDVILGVCEASGNAVCGGIISVTVIIKFPHTQNGINVEPEINTKGNYHCIHEMAHAAAMVEYARHPAREIRSGFKRHKTDVYKIKEINNSTTEGNKNVHK